MSPDEYAAALERERRERNEHVRYVVEPDGMDRWNLVRRNRIGMGWVLTSYTTEAAAQSAANALSELRMEEA